MISILFWISLPVIFFLSFVHVITMIHLFFGSRITLVGEG